MPSIRVLLAFLFPRIVGSSHEHTTNGQTPASVGLNRNGAGGIHYTNSYTVEYNSKVNRDGSKFVQLVDMKGAGSSRSEISVDERLVGRGSFLKV
jgi:hypothetical protein